MAAAGTRAAGHDRPPLRERKKQRTREALIGTALALFTEHGFAHTTLDELCDAVEVSKRTFFRNFTSKEDVALAPTQDMWTAFLDELRTSVPDGRPVLVVLRDALLVALDRLAGDDWARRVVLSTRLAARTPSMNAYGLDFCDRTIRASLAVLADRLGFAADDVRLRLTMDILVAAWHIALESWADQPGTPTTADLAARVVETCAAVPGCLTLTAHPGG